MSNEIPRNEQAGFVLEPEPLQSLFQCVDDEHEMSPRLVRSLACAP